MASPYPAFLGKAGRFGQREEIGRSPYPSFLGGRQGLGSGQAPSPYKSPYPSFLGADRSQQDGFDQDSVLMAQERPASKSWGEGSFLRGALYFLPIVGTALDFEDWVRKEGNLWESVKAEPGWATLSLVAGALDFLPIPGLLGTKGFIQMQKKLGHTPWQMIREFTRHMFIGTTKYMTPKMRETQKLLRKGGFADMMKEIAGLEGSQLHMLGPSAKTVKIDEVFPGLEGIHYEAIEKRLEKFADTGPVWMEYTDGSMFGRFETSLDADGIAIIQKNADGSFSGSMDLGGETFFFGTMKDARSLKEFIASVPISPYATKRMGQLTAAIKSGHNPVEATGNVKEMLKKIREEVRNSPYSDLVKNRRNRLPPTVRFINKREMEHVFQAAADDKTKAGMRNEALLEVLHRGLRSSEILGLNIEDVVFNHDLQRGFLRVRTAKQKLVPGTRLGDASAKKPVTRRVDFYKPAYEALTEYVKHVRPTWYPDAYEGAGEAIAHKALFVDRRGKRLRPTRGDEGRGLTGIIDRLFARAQETLKLDAAKNPDGWVNEIMLEAGARLSISGLRNTFAVHAWEAGGSPKAIQEIMGHATEETTRRYIAGSPLFDPSFGPNRADLIEQAADMGDDAAVLEHLQKAFDGEAEHSFKMMLRTGYFNDVSDRIQMMSRDGLLDQFPEEDFIKMHKVKLTQSGMSHYAPREEMFAWIDTLGDSVIGIRDRAMVRLTYDGIIRPGELGLIKLQDVMDKANLQKFMRGEEWQFNGPFMDAPHHIRIPHSPKIAGRKGKLPPRRTVELTQTGAKWLRQHIENMRKGTGDLRMPDEMHEFAAKYWGGGGELDFKKKGIINWTTSRYSKAHDVTTVKGRNLVARHIAKEYSGKTAPGEKIADSMLKKIKEIMDKLDNPQEIGWGFKNFGPRDFIFQRTHKKSTRALGKPYDLKNGVSKLIRRLGKKTAGEEYKVDGKVAGMFDRFSSTRIRRSRLYHGYEDGQTVERLAMKAGHVSPGMTKEKYLPTVFDVLLEPGTPYETVVQRIATLDSGVQRDQWEMAFTELLDEFGAKWYDEIDKYIDYASVEKNYGYSKKMLQRMPEFETRNRVQAELIVNRIVKNILGEGKQGKNYKYYDPEFVGKQVEPVRREVKFSRPQIMDELRERGQKLRKRQHQRDADYFRDPENAINNPILQGLAPTEDMDLFAGHLQDELFRAGFLTGVAEGLEVDLGTVMAYTRRHMNQGRNAIADILGRLTDPLGVLRGMVTMERGVPRISRGVMKVNGEVVMYGKKPLTAQHADAQMHQYGSWHGTNEKYTKGIEKARERIAKAQDKIDKGQDVKNTKNHLEAIRKSEETIKRYTRDQAQHATSRPVSDVPIRETGRRPTAGEVESSKNADMEFGKRYGTTEEAREANADWARQRLLIPAEHVEGVDTGWKGTNRWRADAPVPGRPRDVYGEGWMEKYPNLDSATGYKLSGEKYSEGARLKNLAKAAMKREEVDATLPSEKYIDTAGKRRFRANPYYNWQEAGYDKLGNFRYKSAAHEVAFSSGGAELRRMEVRRIARWTSRDASAENKFRTIWEPIDEVGRKLAGTFNRDVNKVQILGQGHGAHLNIFHMEAMRRGVTPRFAKEFWEARIKTIKLAEENGLPWHKLFDDFWYPRSDSELLPADVKRYSLSNLQQKYGKYAFGPESNRPKRIEAFKRWGGYVPDFAETNVRRIRKDVLEILPQLKQLMGTSQANIKASIEEVLKMGPTMEAKKIFTRLLKQAIKSGAQDALKNYQEERAKLSASIRTARVYASPKKLHDAKDGSYLTYNWGTLLRSRRGIPINRDTLTQELLSRQDPRPWPRGARRVVEGRGPGTPSFGAQRDAPAWVKAQEKIDIEKAVETEVGQWAPRSNREAKELKRGFDNKGSYNRKLANMTDQELIDEIDRLMELELLNSEEIRSLAKSHGKEADEVYEWLLNSQGAIGGLGDVPGAPRKAFMKVKGVAHPGVELEKGGRWYGTGWRAQTGIEAPWWEDINPASRMEFGPEPINRRLLDYHKVSGEWKIREDDVRRELREIYARTPKGDVTVETPGGMAIQGGRLQRWMDHDIDRSLVSIERMREGLFYTGDPGEMLGATFLSRARGFEGRRAYDAEGRVIGLGTRRRRRGLRNMLPMQTRGGDIRGRGFGEAVAAGEDVAREAEYGRLGELIAPEQTRQIYETPNAQNGWKVQSKVGGVNHPVISQLVIDMYEDFAPILRDYFFRVKSSNPAYMGMVLQEHYMPGILDESLRALVDVYQNHPQVQKHIPQRPWFPHGIARQASDSPQEFMVDSWWAGVASYVVAAETIIAHEPPMRLLRKLKGLAAEGPHTKQSIRGMFGWGREQVGEYMENPLFAKRGMSWKIDQALAVLGGVGHDPYFRDSEFVLAFLEKLPGVMKGGAKALHKFQKVTGKVKIDEIDERAFAAKLEFYPVHVMTPADKNLVSITTKVSRQLYRGLLFGRLPTAIAQFTQLINTAADLGIGNTMRGATIFGREAVRHGGVEAGFKTFKDPESLLGAAMGAGALAITGFGPVAMAVAAAVVPASRALKSFAFKGIPEKVAGSIGVNIGGAKLLRGDEFLAGTNLFYHYLDEIGFSSLDAAETIIRGVTFMTAMDVATQQGFRGPAAVERAIAGVVKTQFVYDQLARHPFWRNSMTGSIMAPLSSFPLKQGGFIRKMMTENASDGASSSVAMARYLFINGIVAQVLQEATEEMFGEELVPGSLRARIDPPVVHYFFGPAGRAGVKAPAGFESVAAFSPGRTPGPQIVAAFSKWLNDPQHGNQAAELMDMFVKNFVPFGLVVSDLYRAGPRIEEGAIRRQEGVYTQLTRGSTVGGVVRETTIVREYGRIFGFVSPEEANEMDQERRANAYANSYINTYVIQESERIMRDPSLNDAQRRIEFQELAQTKEGIRKSMMGGITASQIEQYGRTRLERSFRKLNVPFRQLVMAGLRGTPGAREQALAAGMTTREWYMWGNVARRLLREQGRNP